ncbi:hypothetical protein QJS10_CPB18g00607 [Acorus calamus]|uniref:Uncharacterized protein n=1 Tax=Acorus calamus TaxID=4465 RepID=A0AAV9CL06_ACOCL|nr:hypothetical protein QJS10_CPB18g00607 [Acorus calamus]
MSEGVGPCDQSVDGGKKGPPPATREDWRYEDVLCDLETTGGMVLVKGLLGLGVEFISSIARMIGDKSWRQGWLISGVLKGAHGTYAYTKTFKTTKLSTLEAAQKGGSFLVIQSIESGAMGP